MLELVNILVQVLGSTSKHEYDTKLAKLEANFDSKQKEIEAIRNGSLTSLAECRKILYSRQIQAIEVLWDAVIKLTPAKAASTTLAVINYDKAINASAKDSQVREMFTELSPINLKDMLGSSIVFNEQPFLSPLVWAYYSAYEAIVWQAAIRMEMLKKGAHVEDIINKPHIFELIKVALPHRVENIDRDNLDGLHYFLEELEEKILKALGLMLSGAELDEAALERAANITKRAEELSAANSKELI